MALIEGGLARMFGAGLASLYRSATLHRVTRVRTRGGSTSEVVADVPCRAQVDHVDERMRDGAGVAEPKVRILVLAASLDGSVSSDDRITVDGTRYSIAGVRRDAAGSYFELRGQRG